MAGILLYCMCYCEDIFCSNINQRIWMRHNSNRLFHNPYQMSIFHLELCIHIVRICKVQRISWKHSDQNIFHQGTFANHKGIPHHLNIFLNNSSHCKIIACRKWKGVHDMVYRNSKLFLCLYMLNSLLRNSHILLLLSLHILLDLELWCRLKQGIFSH